MYLLNMNVEVKQTFTPVPMVSYRSSRKLSSYLTRAKLYPIERIVGSKGCGKKCCRGQCLSLSMFHDFWTLFISVVSSIAPVAYVFFR